MTDKHRLTNAELWQALDEAQQRKGNATLPLDARVRSAQTYALCLRAAHDRGLDHRGLREAAQAEAAAAAGHA